MKPGAAQHLSAEEHLGHAQIKVVGVGGAGVNAVRRMADSGIPGVDVLCVNTDASSLAMAEGLPCMVLGAELTRGLGAGGNPETGKRAAEESRDEIREEVRGADLVFIAAGMGGGTGTGAAPIVARVARDEGALVVPVVTMPFSFEGSRRRNVAAEGLSPLKMMSDTTLIVSNDRLLSHGRRSTSVRESFSLADQVIVDAITAISRIINVPGEINVDFADIRAVVESGGVGVMATGKGEGTDRVLKAAQAAVGNPLMDASAHGAMGVVFTVIGSPDLTMNELNEAGQYVASVADANAQIFFGMHIDPSRQDYDPVETVLIATRIPERGEPDEDRADIARQVEMALERYHEEPGLPPFLRGLDREEDGPRPSEDWRGN